MSKSQLKLPLILASVLFTSIHVEARPDFCTIPLELRNGVPFVRLMVNGSGPFTFIVDTGTNKEAIVSPQLAKALGLPVVDQISMVDLTGQNRTRVDEVAIDTISIAGHQFHGVRALVHKSLTSEGAYDGVLGFSLFRNTLLTLDFPQRCMALSDGDLLESRDSDVLPFVAPRNIPMVTLTVGGQPVTALIDSGGAGLNLPRSFALHVEFVKSTEILEEARTQTSSYFLRGGEMKGQILLGSHVFKDPFVLIGEALPVASVGAIPLQDFAITFDQKHLLVRFRANRNKHRLERRQLQKSRSMTAPGLPGDLTLAKAGN